VPLVCVPLVPEPAPLDTVPPLGPLGRPAGSVPTPGAVPLELPDVSRPVAAGRPDSVLLVALGPGSEFTFVSLRAQPASTAPASAAVAHRK
jgi:hypothetical protein